ncbi:MAG: sterol desaturase family protein, partial [Rhodospirillales bacterium]|nr:sterol desaturase family protein [Rhodospirillales bacterium]
NYGLLLSVWDRLFMPLLVVPLGLSTVAAGYAAHSVLTQLFAPSHHPGPAGVPLLVAFTLSMVLAYDLSYYIYHYLCHRVPLLWELHKVHHSAEVMVGVTKDRVHPLDEILNRWWNGLIPGVTYGIWLFFALDPVELTVFGLSAYMLRALLMMDVVRHTHLEMSYGPWLNRVFLCPYWHQLHHSIEPRHYNRNYGLLLSVWDRLFGTLAIPQPNEHFTFGLADEEHVEYRSLARLHLVPLRKIWGLTRAWLQERMDSMLVRLGLQEDLGESVLPHVLGQFARAHPHVRIEASVARSDELRERMALGQFDLALLWDVGMNHACVHGEHIMRLPLQWIGPASLDAAEAGWARG